MFFASRTGNVWRKRTGIGVIAGFSAHYWIWDTTSLAARFSDVLERHGIKPAPQRRRKTTRKEFLKRRWESIVATDFFTAEVWTARGLQRYIILFFSNLSTGREIGGVSPVAQGSRAWGAGWQREKQVLRLLLQ